MRPRVSAEPVREATPWYQRLNPRDPDERGRGVSPLELFFDLCFAVAIAQATVQLTEAYTIGRTTDAVLSYAAVFFSIWWAWMNFTWFASAYDNDDAVYRLTAFVQIVGALILAAGVPSAFEHGNFEIVFTGYAVMRTGLIASWLRAAGADPDRRRTALRYTAGLVGCMLGWSAMLVAADWPLRGWWTMAALELSVPLWAEAARPTPWNPHHIVRRYERFMIIVLGQSVLAAANAVRLEIGEAAPLSAGDFANIGGGLAILFSLWWLYFDRRPNGWLHSPYAAFAWGYGHYFVFAAAAALGAGLAVHLGRAATAVPLESFAAASTVTLPVVVFLIVLGLLQWAARIQALLYVGGAALVAALAASPWPLLSTGLATAGLVGLASRIDSTSRP